MTERLLRLKGRLNKRLHKRGWLMVGGVLLAVGLWRSDWRDDIRQWVTCRLKCWRKCNASDS